MIKVFFSLLVLGLLMTGCNSAAPTAEESIQTSSGYTLEGPKWQLVSFGLTRMTVPKDAHLIFTEGRYNGKGGCNQIGGSYTKEASALRFKEGMSTMMACLNMDLEREFQQRLLRVDSYVIEGNMLDLQVQGHSLLRFKAQQ